MPINFLQVRTILRQERRCEPKIDQIEPVSVFVANEYIF